jgi:hypothetical protein
MQGLGKRYTSQQIEEIRDIWADYFKREHVNLFSQTFVSIVDCDILNFFPFKISFCSSRYAMETPQDFAAENYMMPMEPTGFNHFYALICREDCRVLDILLLFFAV